MRWRRLACIAQIVLIGATVRTANLHSDFAGLVTINGGRRLYLECRGTGRPTVILESGLRVRSDYWSANNVKGGATSVLPGVSKFTRVCTYDRPGTVIGLSIRDRSRSDPVPMPRSAMSAVDDLHSLVWTAKLSRPFVLAGHSTGGLLARLYAHEFPEDVAGLVLIDALPDGLENHLTIVQYAAFLRLNENRPADLTSYKAYETIPFPPAFVELRRLQREHPLAPMPLVIVSRGLPVALPLDNIPSGFSQALERAWRLEQARMVELEPGARQVIATRSEHYIMLEQPACVIQAIHDVVTAVRSQSKKPSAIGRYCT